jgi:RHS repeat-associated protein
MGEKFSANPVTGTGSMSVPIYTSPGRSGFGPRLSLSYDSGAGNGPFGFGWSLSLPAITRKTDKGLPKYQDADESDVFILSGAEDLVPLPDEDQPDKPRPVDGVDYRVRRYRPRIEGLFARIERWTNESEPTDVFWRSISKDNITTWYGKTRDSRIGESRIDGPRIVDPSDARRIFSWLICESYDDKGNAIIYEYKSEDSHRIFEDEQGQSVASAHERNRDNSGRTANRYLKRIKYGNRTPNRNATTWRPDPAQLSNETWMFEVVFDYGEGHYTEDTPDAQGRTFARARIDLPPESHWPARQDRFSTYRAGFEVRTYRLCCRVLMFHHFPQELGISDCLVRSTEFSYAEDPIASFITGVTQAGYVRQPQQNHPDRYLKKGLPPLEFEYSQVPGPEQLAWLPIRELDAESVANLPVGLDGDSYQWMDLDGEGTSGILTEQADAWYYKRNLSANNQVREDGHERTIARFGPLEQVASKPAGGLAGGAKFLDLAGDGQVDLVQMEGSVRGFYERTDDAGWAPFRPFDSWPVLDTHEPNLTFVDLSGDGHTDILITEGEALTWYPSLAEDGFGPAIRLSLPSDEERGPRLVLADGLQSVYLADLSGDGLSDLVRICNGEVCYWPNLGYGHFGPKVTMDNAPWFDSDDQFDQRRIRLADTDGSGTTDILYLRRDGVQIYFNKSGNGWRDAVALPQFPPSDNISSVQALDLLGNGTACLLWSSPLPGAARRPMRYLAPMEEKPHLLVGVKNNLGAETKVQYASSTKFYLQDEREGKPWITRLPFPVHVVERVETQDHISGNRFVTSYKYHHGYFDGEEREFRGFGMVEQRDTEEFAALTGDGTLPPASNIELASHVPPVLTRTWFHTGVYLGSERVSDYFAGLLDAHDRGEFYREPAWRDDDPEAKKRLLPDTDMPPGLAPEEEREACRALKGSMLRQEVYALDGSGDEDYPFGHPYTVTEQNFTISVLQHRGDNRHAAFFTHPREAISYHYERNQSDPRISHALTLEVDPYGNALKSLDIGYRRKESPLPEQRDREKQTRTLIAFTDNRFTNAIDDKIKKPDGTVKYPDDYRTPLPAETRTYELTGFSPENSAERFSFDEWTRKGFELLGLAVEIPYEQKADNATKQKRPIERVRTLYRKDDLTALLPLSELEPELEPLALPGESYKLAFTPGLLARVFDRDGQASLTELANVLGGQGVDRGGYVDLDGDGHWWIPSGRVSLSPHSNDAAVQEELDYARRHFFLPHLFRDPFGAPTTVAYDSDDTDPAKNHNLLVVQTRDPLDNTVVAANDYRVLQPYLVTDPNGNRSEAAYDALGLVAGSAVMGKEDEPDHKPKGDVLDDEFQPDPTQDQIGAFLTQPREPGASPSESVATQIVHKLLGKATTRVVYDLHRYRDTASSANPQPAFAATIARETHVANPSDNERSNSERPKLQISFSYSDGFGREIQKKIQAEPGPVPRRDAQGDVIVDADGQPEMAANDVSPRWVGSGWTVFNNKGKPVRRYEPFFTDTHRFEFDVKIGVSPVLFYDPVERVVATLHPNHTYEKVVFDPWQQAIYDVNDTVTSDPRNDDDIGGYVSEHFKRVAPKPENWKTWLEQRMVDPLAPPQDTPGLDPEKKAAVRTLPHADTPTLAHFDAVGRAFLTIARNKFKREKPDGTIETIEEEYPTRVELDIEGNQREVRDAIVQNGDAFGRIVMRFDYDLLANRIHQSSMEAGERWMLGDVAGKPIRAWDSRSFDRLMSYDELRRPTGLFVTENGTKRLAECTVYGESLGDAGIASNHRTRVHKVFDGAGVVTNEAYDFKGNLLRTKRELLPDYKQTVDWQQSAIPDDGTPDDRTFTSSTNYDALNRQWTVTTPDNSVYHPTFNEANLLDKVDVELRGAASTPFVTNINYDAKGQRKLIVYGNGAQTTYEYDRFTFRLIHLKTTRPAGLNGLAPIFADPTVLQDLLYTYDPAGNIIRIEDAALSRVFHNGQQEPVCEYTYDAIYRLVKAQGREHIGQMVHDFDPPEGDRRDHPFVGHRVHSNDLQALRTYTERYEYDAVGNFQFMRHSANGGSWTRRYEYEEESLTERESPTEPGKTSNRLTRTTVGNGLNHIEKYTYRDSQGNDVQGCMTNINTMKMTWDFEDQLQQVELGGGGKAYYVYDASGQRVRKIIHRQNGNRQEERIYLDGYEVYREYNGNGQTVTLERETLRVMDDKQRIALVETQTEPTVEQPLIRYELGNHLGSASLELDKRAGLISYEEYHPYGTTAFQAKSVAEMSLKRYRYTGKERDEESGLYYHGARYYAPWLGRWVSCDPKLLIDGIDLYLYCKDSPIDLRDPKGTGSKGASEGSVLTGTVDPTLDKKGIGFNTETKLEITLRCGTVVNRRLDRFYQNPEGDWIAIEAKGEQPEDLTPNERLADRDIQMHGARFRVLRSAGAPPPGHGQYREDIPFRTDFAGEIKPGNFQHVHGNVNHLATVNQPATATAALWKRWMESRYKDAPGHEGMIRKTNPNAAPTWITHEQEAAAYAKNTGDKSNQVERAAGWMTVKPKDNFLATNRHPASMGKQVVLGTALAIPVVTAPLWVPALIEATPQIAKASEAANRARIAVEEAGGPKVRVAEEKALEYIEDTVINEGKKFLKKMIFE